MAEAQASKNLYGDDWKSTPPLLLWTKPAGATRKLKRLISDFTSKGAGPTGPSAPRGLCLKTSVPWGPLEFVDCALKLLQWLSFIGYLLITYSLTSNLCMNHQVMHRR